MQCNCARHIMHGEIRMPTSAGDMSRICLECLMTVHEGKEGTPIGVLGKLHSGLPDVPPAAADAIDKEYNAVVQSCQPVRHVHSEAARNVHQSAGHTESKKLKSTSFERSKSHPARALQNFHHQHIKSCRSMQNNLAY